MSTALPSIPITGAAIYDVIKALGANVDLMTLCAMIPPAVGVLSVLVMYFLGKDIGGRTVGLLSALFLALEPSIIMRTSLGFFDTQVPGTIGLILFVFLFLRSIDNNRSLRASILYSLSAAAALAYFIAGWGGAYYMIDMTVLFVFVIVLLKRYNQRLLLSYSITFGLALYISAIVPYLGLTYLTSGAVIPVAGGFVLLLIAELLRNNITLRSKMLLAITSLVIIVGGFSTLYVTGFITGSGLQGKFSTVLDPFIRASSPIINSVAEQQITAWGNIYIELGIGILFFLIGFYFVLKNPTNRNIFLIVFAITSLFFAASMIRLLAIFAPAFCVIAGIGVLGLIQPFYTLLKEAPHTLAKSKRRMARVSKEYSGVAIFLIFLILMTDVAFSPQTAGGVPRSIGGSFVPTAISDSSLPIGGASLTEPVSTWNTALSWTKSNIPSNNVVVAWWDYGDWLSDIGNVTTLCDNTTYNTTQIENVGFIMMGNENQSMQMLSHYNNYNNPGLVNYILVFTVLAIEQSSSSSGTYVAYPAGYGDEGKWEWMASISGTAEQWYINNGYMSATTSTVWKDATAFGNTSSTTGQWVWNDQGDNSTIYELMNYAEVQYCNEMTAVGYSLSPSATTTTPTYFTLEELAGLDTSPFQYGGLVPLVAIYKINYPAYYNAMGTTGTG
jgi:dolichyl-diphosphooligosaccharide--protein glycosyltransferase